MSNGKLVLVRHGLSVYNDQNRFTGWKDVELNEQGVDEARQTVVILKDYKFDMAFTSNLIRAQDTLSIILEGIGQSDIPIKKDTALNERDYGNLIGQNKAEAAEEFGAEQVHIWRRSYDVPPPGGESLKNTAERVIPYLENVIMSHIMEGKHIIVSAHGNSIRAIVMSQVICTLSRHTQQDSILLGFRFSQVQERQLTTSVKVFNMVVVGSPFAFLCGLKLFAP